MTHDAPHGARSDEAGKLRDMIKDIRVAMMTTVETDGSLRSRPMHHVEAEPTGALWFFTRASAHKTLEIGRHAQVNLAYAEPQRQDYVSVSGRAELVRDRAQIDRLWSPMLTAWFPEGKDDPDIALIRVTPDYAEYWDSPSSTMVHLYGYAKAALTGTTPDPGENEKVRLR